MGKGDQEEGQEYIVNSKHLLTLLHKDTSIHTPVYKTVDITVEEYIKKYQNESLYGYKSSNGNILDTTNIKVNLYITSLIKHIRCVFWTDLLGDYH